MAEKKKTATALTPTTFPQWMQLAETMSKSGLVPKDFKDKPGDCLIAMQMGASVGLNPFQAIQSIAVINGRPCMWGDAVLGIVMASGLCEDINETDDGTTATCTVKRKGKPTPVVRSFSMEMAKAAKVWMAGRDNQPGKWISLSERPGPWQSYPERMRQMRARSWALRDAFPDVLKGLAIREEVDDYGDQDPGEPKNITPRTQEDMAAELMPREKVVAPGASEPVASNGGPSPESPATVLIQDAAPGQAEPPLTPRGGAEEGDIITAEQAPLAFSPKKTVFTVGTQRFETNGINRAQMMELFKLYPRVAKKYGQEKAAEVLKNEFKLEHRADLTEEQAERYTIRLQEMLEG